MKLRNKITGEIKEVIVGGYPVSGKTKMWECSEMDANEETGYKSLGTYSSLSELNSEWEDAPEEPKEHWCITMYGGITRIKDDEEPIDDLIEIGNYFNSKEDAYDAWDKLRAWKRLKDKGFEFCCDIKYESLCGNGFNIPLNAIMPPEAYTDTEVSKDLDLLFEGKE